MGVLVLITYFVFMPCTTAQTVNYVPAPTGVPEIDWQNIQNGLDAMGSGETLQLGSGTYKIHRPLEFENWNGSLIGATSDRDDTVLQVSRASNGDLFAVVHDPQWDDFDFPGSQVFETPVFQVYNAHGLFHIANLTVDVTDVGVAERSYIFDTNTASIVFFIDVWENNNSHLINGALGAAVDVVIENSSFLGAAADQFFGQPNHGIQLAGSLFATVGDYSVRNSYFDAIGTNVVNPIALNDSRIVIEGNAFTDSARPIVLWNNSGCDADIRNNYASNVLQSTVMVWHVPQEPVPTDPCLVNVRGLLVEGGGGVFWRQLGNPTNYVGIFTENDITTKRNSSWAGFELWDAGNSSLMVANNRIHSEGAAFFGPVFTFGTNGATILGNRISGSGPAAMYLGAWPFNPFWPSDDIYMLVEDNDVLKFKPKAHPNLASNACCSGVIPSHYWLGSRTNSNIIVGQDAASDRVFDMGTENIVQSAIHIQQGMPDDPPGQSIFDKDLALAHRGIHH
jgi:hypothetical protein